MTRSWHVWTWALTLLAVGGWTPLEGQEPEPDSVYRIEPVMVRVLGGTIGTGTPYPVSVVAGSELTRGKASAFIEDAVRAVPGVQVQNRYNLAVGERLAIRGFGSRSQFGVRGIRVLVDGIPATLPDGQATLDHLDLAGLGRIEAVRGPAAAAYGNAAGGVLHFRTIDPALEPRAVSVRSTLGSNGLWTGQAHATGGAGGVGYRVGVSRMTYDGFRGDPIADDGSVYGGGTRTIFNGTVDFPLAGGEMRLVANGVDLDARNPGSLPRASVDDEERSAWGFNVISGASKEVRQGQVGATWDRAVGSKDLELAGWFIGRDVWNPIPGRVIALVRNAGGVRGRIQGAVEMSSGTFGWSAGVETELQYDDRQNLDNDGGEAGSLLLDQDESVRSVGVFGQGRLDLTESLSILAGARYDDVRFSATDYFTTGSDPDDSGDRSMSSFSPSLGLVFEARERLELYASVSRAFETPTTTELANRPTGSGGFNPSLEPQHSVTLEAGVRGRPFQLFNVEVSAFTTDVTDGLVAFEVESDPGRTYFRNSGRSDYDGFEVLAYEELMEDATVRLAYTSIDARYVSYAPEGQDYSGNRVPGVARRSLDGILAYAPDAGFVELRGLWRDRVPVDDAGTTRAGPYFLLDVSAGLDELVVANVGLSPFVGIENVTDTYYVASVVPNAFGGRFFEPGPGRTYRVGLGVTWGY